jgi:hypothetical protein
MKCKPAMLPDATPKNMRRSKPNRYPVATIVITTSSC